MLILTRKVGQSIIIDSNIKVMVIKNTPNHIHLGIEAPQEISIHREEIQDKIDAKIPNT